MGVCLPGLPVVPGTLDKLLYDWFGYRATIRNGEWYIPDTDHKLQMGPSDALKMHPRIELHHNNLLEASKLLADAVPDDFDEYFETHKIPDNIKVLSDFGLTSELEIALTKITISKKDELVHNLYKILLPLMLDKVGVRYVVPISLDATMLQSHFSFAKISLLAQRFGKTAMQRLIKGHNVLGGLEMSGALDILGFVDALTRLAPINFTFPIRRHGCSWHFYTDGYSRPNHLINQGFAQQFLTGINPRTTRSVLTNLSGFGHMHEQEIWQLIRQSVLSVNRIMAYINDPRNYTDKDENWDYLKHIQSLGTLHVLFADLLGMNFSTQPHHQITLSFGFLDKLANLKKHLGGISATEASVFCSLASLAQGKELKNLFNSKISDLHPKFGASILPSVGSCFGRLHRHLARQLEHGATSEKLRLQLLRTYRNLNHGVFLQGGEFERRFLTSNVEVPPMLGTLPFLLAHGFGASPERFLRFYSRFG